MKMRTAASFTNTMAELKFADSLMPMTNTAVTIKMPRNATRLKIAVTCGSECQSIPESVNVLWMVTRGIHLF